MICGEKMAKKLKHYSVKGQDHEIGIAKYISLPQPAGFKVEAVHPFKGKIPHPGWQSLFLSCLYFENLTEAQKARPNLILVFCHPLFLFGTPQRDTKQVPGRFLDPINDIR